MGVLLDVGLYVHYRFVVLLADGHEQPELTQARGGQRNGLCGAAAHGALAMVTGLHTGRVPFVLEVCDDEPAPPDWAEEVVEVSLETDGTALRVVTFQDGHELPPLAPGTYRARYSAAGLSLIHI